ncbi:MAG: hypothetical protein ABI807_09945, partial [Sporichthyaceae bacterium]
MRPYDVVGAAGVMLTRVGAALSSSTNDTSQALDRIVDVFLGDQQSQIRVQLASALTGIVYQRLVPRAGGGRVAAYEVLVATQAVRNMIREGKTRQLRSVLSTGSREGMQTLEQSLSGLVQGGPGGPRGRRRSQPVPPGGHRRSVTLVVLGDPARWLYHPPRPFTGRAPVAQRIEHLTTDQEVGG